MYSRRDPPYYGVYGNDMHFLHNIQRNIIPIYTVLTV